MSVPTALSSLKLPPGFALDRIKVIEVEEACSGGMFSATGKRNPYTYHLGCQHPVTVTLSDNQEAELTMNTVMLRWLLEPVRRYRILLRMSDRTAMHVKTTHHSLECPYITSEMVAKWIGAAFLTDTTKKDYYTL